MTIKDLISSVFILKKSKEANLSKQVKDVEARSSIKANGRKRKNPTEDSNADGQKSCDDACESLGFALLIESEA